MSGLQVRGLTVRREGSPVVREVDFDVEPASITVLLGANGAGKTSALEAISGIVAAEEGTISLDGQAIQRASRRKRALLGVAHVEQGRAVFADLTVEENLRAAVRDRDPGQAYELFPELTRRRDVAAGLLSGGEQQMLVLARAILGAPRYLLVDEMSLGLAPVIVRRLVPVVRRLADEDGVGVLLVEQFAHLALSVADRAYVLRHGRLVFAGEPGPLREQADLLHSAYLGNGTSPGGEGA